MNYVKGILSALAATLMALTVGCWPAIREISAQKQTGLGAFAGGISALLISPLPLLILATFSIGFFGASQLQSKPLRISLFWIPAVTFSTILVAVISLYGLLLAILLSRRQ